MGVQTRNDVTIRKPKTAGSTRGIDSAIFAQVSAATTANVTDTTSYAVTDQDGLAMTIDAISADRSDLNLGPQTVTFPTGTTTALLVAAAINNQGKGINATVTGGQVVVSSDAVGADMTIVIDVGTTNLTWDTPVAGTGGVGVAKNTVVAKNPSTKKWVALTDVTATDGTEMPRGIFVGSDISAADLEAGDVTNQMVVTGGDAVDWDKDLLLFQGGISLTDEITNQNLTVEDALANIGIFAQDVEYVSQHENA